MCGAIHAKTVGVVRWNEDKTLDLNRLLLPIYNKNQEIVAVR
jgi:exonuclease SbcD